MAIAIRGSPQSATTTNGGNAQITFGTAPQAGDVIIIVAAHGAAVTTITAPGTASANDGTYTQIAVHTGSAPICGAWYRISTGSESKVIFNGGSNSADAVAMCSWIFSGVSKAVQDASVTTAGPTTSTNPNPASITTTIDNGLVLAAAASTTNDSSPGTITGYSNQATANITDTNPITVSGMTKAIAAHGAEDPDAFSSWSSGTWFTFTISLRPPVVNTSSLSGAVSFAGSALKEVAHSLLGALSFAGSVAKNACKFVAGFMTAGNTLSGAPRITLVSHQSITPPTPFNYSHGGPSVSPSAVLVGVASVATAGGVDLVTGVTYGGVAMTELPGSPVAKSTGEAASVRLFFLASPPSGTQTVSVSSTTTHTLFLMAASLADATSVTAVSSAINSDSVADPSAVVDPGGVLSMAAIYLVSGGSPSPSPDGTEQFSTSGAPATQVVALYSIDTPFGGATSVGWQQTADDATAIIALLGQVNPVTIEGDLSLIRGKLFSAALSFSTAATKFVSHGLSSALSFVGSLPKLTSRTTSAMLSFAGNHLKQAGKALAGAISFAGNHLKQAGKALAGALSFIGSIPSRAVSHVLSSALSFVGSAAKSTSRALSGALSFVGSLAAHSAFFRIFSGAVSFSGTSSKNISYVLSAALSFAGSVSRTVSRSLAAAGSFVGQCSKSTSRATSAALSFAGSVAKRAARSLPGVLSFAGAVAKLANKALVGATSFVGSATKLASRALAGALSFSGAIRKTTSRALSAALSFSGAASRRVARSLSGAASFAGSVARSISRALSGTLSFAGATARQTAKLLDGSAAFASDFARSTAKALSGALSFATSFIGHLVGTGTEYFVSLAASLSFSGAATTALFHRIVAAVWRLARRPVMFVARARSALWRL